MTTNREVFERDPTTYTLPNDGVAKVVETRSDEEWKVARYEMEHFVCEGSYHDGLRRILESYLANLGQPNQRAVWVHGFYGCGKSHLVRVLEFLWRDIRFPDGATARGLANLPNDIRDALTELSNAGRQRGGLWSAAGTLGAGTAGDPRAAMLGVVLRSAGLPERVNLAQFDLWLREERWLDAVKSGLERHGRRYERELQNLFVSTPLAEELLRANPNFASSPAAALEQIRAQYPNIEEVTTDTMVEIMRQVFVLMSDKADKLPCVLLVLDELQQYLGDSHERTEIVREGVEACVSRFRSDLLFVATGQSAMTATSILQRLQGRFTIHVAIEDKDTDRVLRQTVLRKKPTAEPEISSLLESVRGEIDRHLGGTQIEPQSSDSELLVSDYPLLPTRRRFWQKVLRGLDRSGTAAQLRTQLRLAHEAAAAVAKDPIGCVVGGDLIFEQQRPTLLQTAVLLREVNEAIAAEDDGTPDGKLRARICALLFLIKEVDATVGLRATADTLADLLVTDLPAGSAALRQRIPELLKDLVERGVIMQDGDEYQIWTREFADWYRDYRSRNAAIKGDDARISREREGILRGAVEGILKGLPMPQGVSKTPRQYDLHFGSDAPVVEAKVTVWVRSGWDITESAVKREAGKAGADSPIVFVHLPRQEADDLKPQIAGYLAADEVLQTRPAPTTDEGRAARSSVQTHKDTHNTAIQTLVANVLDNARVFQGGGTEVQALDLRSTLERAFEASLLRLYRRFPEADLSTWNRVSERARQGDPDALAHIGYSGDPSEHPVCREILAFIGPSGKTGNDIRRQFEAPPYGWPRDAILATLTVLTASGHLRARYRSQPASAPELTGTTIQQTEFRAEQRVITTAERLAIRRLLTDTGVAHKPGGEATAVRDLLEQMTNLAEAAGGPPPLPAKPPTDYIDDLKAQTGNELLAAVHERREQLLKDYTDWTEAKQKIGERLPRWERLQKLLEHAKVLPVHAEVSAEAQAILDGRRLLAEPDPVPPLVSKVCDALRKAVREARDRHLQAYDDKMKDLLENDTWQRLPQDRQDDIRSRRGLVALPPLNVETEDDLLREMDETPLSAWEDKTAAMAERVTEALLDAARELEPKARRVVLRSTTIRNEQELDQYLADVRRQALDVIEEGNPVVLP